MFDGRLQEKVRVKLEEVLSNLLSPEYKFLQSIKSDDFGKRLSLCSSKKMQQNDAVSGSYNAQVARDTLATLSIQTNFSKNELLCKFTNHTPSADTCVQSLDNLVSELRKIETVTGHNKEQSNKALKLIIPYIELSLISNTIARESDKDKRWSYLTSPKWEEIAKGSDVLSSKVKQATHLYSLGYHQASLDILKQVDVTAVLEETTTSYISHVTSTCHCRDLPTWRSEESKTDSGHISCDIEIKDYYQAKFAPCIAFLPFEKDIVPDVLRYELLRSTGMPKDSRNDRLEYWYDWAVVDSKILLYFMLYLNHQKFEQEAEKNDDIKKIVWLVKNDFTFGHKETALNLLGWIFKQEGDVENAVICYQASLSMHNSHNAATLHLKDIENAKKGQCKVL